MVNAQQQAWSGNMCKHLWPIQVYQSAWWVNVLDLWAIQDQLATMDMDQLAAMDTHNSNNGRHRTPNHCGVNQYSQPSLNRLEVYHQVWSDP